MSRSFADVSDSELERRFLEAERNALAWAALGVGERSDARGSKWMQIASELRAEILRRGDRIPGKKKTRKKGSRVGR